MSFDPTFGGLGDFVSIVVLIKDIVLALDGSRGSAKKYQDLVRSLDILSTTIEAVEKAYRGPRHAAGFDNISVTALQTVRHIRTCLKDFTGRLQKYGPSLSLGGLGNPAKDAARKIQFKAMEEDEIQSFQMQVLGYNMLLKTLLDVTML